MPGVATGLIERLRAAGTRALFGLPGGGGNLDFIEEAGRAGLPFVLTATETGAALAAIAQAEISGAPGACLTTIGPGAASAANGVACAMLDRAPLLVITDSYASRGAPWAHQRVDHRALMAPITKWSGSLAPPHAAAAIARAFDELTGKPPGPVHLDCPADFETDLPSAIAQADATSLQDADPPRGFSELLSRARRPLLLVGLGARDPAATAEVRALCETKGIPALVTYKAKGVVADGHPWFAGVFTHGAVERALIEDSDLLIGVGFDPVEILPRPWTYAQSVVSVAGWRMPDDHVPFAAQYVTTVSRGVRDCGQWLAPSSWNAGRPGESAAAAIRGSDWPGPGLTAQDVVRQGAARLAGHARVTVDAGAHMFPATTLWPVAEPGGMLISNGLSTMGFALPAAIGAALVERDRRVVALTGDGGLLICLGELATAARERLPILVIVFSDAALSLIEIKQRARRLAPMGVSLGDLDWLSLARGFGLPAWRAETSRELDVALEEATSVSGPALIEARIDRSNYGATLRAIRG